MMIISLRLNARNISSFKFKFCIQTLLQLCNFPLATFFLVLELALIQYN